MSGGSRCHKKSTGWWSKSISAGIVLASIGNASWAIAYLRSSPEGLSLYYPYVIASVGSLLVAMFLVYRAIFEDDR